MKTVINSVHPGAAFDHHPGGDEHPPYQIPLSCLISRDLSNLVMGGRCISGDFTAHGSYRVGGPAFRTGEMVGRLAACCVRTGQLPQNIETIF